MASTGIAPPMMGNLLREKARQGSDGPRLSTTSIPRRRSSVLSYASDTKQSVHSSASDFILPSLAVDRKNTPEENASHWHSSPLAFAILPAVGGLFFKDGSAFITDVLLLGLAAIFLNWSVRLPWQWYHSAQAICQASTRKQSTFSDKQHDQATNQDDTLPSSPNRSPNDSVILDEVPSPKTPKEPEIIAPAGRSEQDLAIDKLRVHEKLALLATFLFPALGAFLLHIIRNQLSRGSTALVSDYNLTIFLLAAEIRPFKQLIQLVTNRTLHLQRIANDRDFPPTSSSERNAEYESRLEILEAKVSDPSISPIGSNAFSHKEEVATLSSDIRKRYEPRIDALERAVRRYEKRVTTLTMLTDQRLLNLDNRLQDTLSLAAVAAQSSQTPSVLSATVTYFARIAMMPVEAVCALIMLPIRIVEDGIRMIFYKSTMSKSKQGIVGGEKMMKGDKGLRTKEKRSVKEDYSPIAAKA